MISHVRIAETPAGLDAVRIGELSADLLLGCDMVVAGSLDALTRCDTGRTHAVVNTHETPTADFTMDTTVSLPAAATKRAIRTRMGEELCDFLDVTSLATNLFGDAIATNLMLLGYAWQKGFIPLAGGSIERAIELNQVAVQQNLKSFRWGRLLAHDPGAVHRRAFEDKVEALPLAQSPEEKDARRLEFLTNYQNKSLAERYKALVARVRAAEDTVKGGSTTLTEVVAESYFRLLAYKDEYEVARAWSDPALMRKVRSEFAGDFKLKFHMAPPVIAKRDKESGQLKKRELPGQVMAPLLRGLSQGRRLRGTFLDPFGYQAERKLERALIGEFEETVDQLLEKLTSDNLAMAVAIAGLPQKIKGYGHIKMDNYRTIKPEWDSLLVSWKNNETISLAAE